MSPQSHRTSDGEYTCLLRWPTPQEGSPLPVVKAKPGLSGLKLIALSTLDLAHRLAAEEDASQGREADWVNKESVCACVCIVIISKEGNQSKAHNDMFDDLSCARLPLPLSPGR